MRFLPPSLWLLVTAQIEAQAQAQSHSLPTAIRKMVPDAGEKFYPDYYAFVAAGPPPDPQARAAFDSRQPAERDALLPTANASSPQLDFRPPFAPHSAGGARDGQPWTLADRGIAGGGDYSRPFTRRAAARGALAKLEGRQWACPGDTKDCADIGYPNSCCGADEKCMKIDDTGLGSVGCCPSGSTCGGTISNCGQGNTACESDLGGGCCIPGYVCKGVGCVPSPPATTSTPAKTGTSSAHTSTARSTTTTKSSSSSRTASHESTGTTGTNGASAPVRPTLSASDPDYCPTGFYPCLASAGGGCCQTGRDCKTTSCPPITSTTILTDHGVTVAVPVTAVPTGQLSADCAGGWYLCDGDAGGAVPGCCPTGYSCGTASCMLTTAGTTTSTSKELPNSSKGKAALAAGHRGLFSVTLAMNLFMLL